MLYAGIKESDTGLAPPALWDLAADKQTLQSEQPLQVARWVDSFFDLTVELHSVREAIYNSHTVFLFEEESYFVQIESIFLSLYQKAYKMCIKCDI